MTRIQGAVPQTSCGSTSTNQVSRARPRPKYLQCQVVYLVSHVLVQKDAHCDSMVFQDVKRDTRDWRDTNGQETKSPASFNDSIHFCSSLDTFQTIQINSTMQGKPSSIQTSKLLSVIHNWRIKSEEIHLMQHNMFYSVIRRHHSHWMHWGGQEMNNMLRVGLSENRVYYGIFPIIAI